jgi:DNA-binding SARP family transcriptional activator
MQTQDGQDGQPPAFRVWTFGRFLVERFHPRSLVDGPMPVYVPVKNEEWAGRGTARSLLRFLLCRGGGRRAAREVIIDALWPGALDSENGGTDSLNAAVSALRGVLDTGGTERFLTVEKATETTIYALAERQRIWVDLDEFETLLDRAAYAQRRGDDPVPLLEQAYQLSRKDFLEDERNSEWAEERRREVQAAQHRCVHWLATLYQERSLDELAEAIFQQVFEQNPADEDVLYALMKILARQGRSQEALRLYRRCARDLQETIHRRPAKRVRELAEHIQNEPVVLERKPSNVPARIQRLSIPYAHGQPEETGLSPREHESPRREGEGLLVPGVPHRLKTDDPLICYGFMQSSVIDLVYRWNVHEQSCHELQRVIGREIRSFDQMQPQLPRSNEQEWKLSRRQAIVAIAGLPTALLFHLQQEPTSAFAAEEFLPQCAASLTACWQLTNGSNFAGVELVLPRFLPRLEMLALQASKYQKQAAALASQGHQLAYIITSHQEDFNTALAHCRQALTFGQIAEDPNLQGASLARQAVTFLHRKRPVQTLRSYQEALPFVNQLSPLLRARLYAGLAEVHGKLGQEQEALQSIGLAHDNFPDHPEDDPSSLYTHFERSSLFLHEGLAFLDLHQPANASRAFAHVDGLFPKMLVSERSRVDFLNQQAMTARVQNDIEQFCAYMEAAVTSALALGSDLRYSEAWNIYEVVPHAWHHEPRIKALRGLFVK